MLVLNNLQIKYKKMNQSINWQVLKKTSIPSDTNKKMGTKEPRVMLIVLKQKTSINDYSYMNSVKFFFFFFLLSLS